MRIAVPKEIMNNENRVALTPSGAQTLVHDGHEVLIPFVTEIVPEVDTDAGRIALTPPAGLLDAE